MGVAIHDAMPCLHDIERLEIVLLIWFSWGCMGTVKVGNSVSDSALGIISQGSKLLTGGGFEGLYKQTFGLAPNERFLKTYACYLSTSRGPISGTLYITNQKFAFCSDRPIAYAPNPGQQALSYYKVLQLLSLYVFSWASQASSGILVARRFWLLQVVCPGRLEFQWAEWPLMFPNQSFNSDRECFPDESCSMQPKWIQSGFRNLRSIL